MRFEFATTARVVFGWGASDEIGGLVRDLGRHALLVTGRSPERAARVGASLAAEGLATTTFAIEREPSVATIEQGVAVGRAAGCDMVIGIGGGSALDGAKAIAALVANEGSVVDYLEVVGRGRPLRRPSMPCVAIPTTAGTGSEVTRNAVLTSPEHRVKVSLRSPHMLPRLAVVDPGLTLDLPPALTASTGLDALTQVLEPYVSSRANPVTDALCLEGMRRAASALLRAFRDGGDRDAREQMALASLSGGMALANAGLGAVHGFAGPIGGMFEAPHGAVCAALLPHVVEGNLRALARRAPTHAALARYADVARLLAGRSTASGSDAVTWLHELVDALEIPPLRHYGLTTDHIDAVVEQAARASSMNGNPIELTTAELREILSAALQRVS
jgi:alcohol dehydrogenase class IV